MTKLINDGSEYGLLAGKAGKIGVFEEKANIRFFY